MELIIYLGKRVYLTISNGYYYTGLVCSADEDSLTILDKNQKRVTLRKDQIETIREVSSNG